jgi:hypothetical protein
MLEEFRQEISIMKRLRHPHIVQFVSGCSCLLCLRLWLPLPALAAAVAAAACCGCARLLLLQLWLRLWLSRGGAACVCCRYKS